MEDEYSNGRVRQLVSKYSGKGKEDSRRLSFSVKLLQKWVWLDIIIKEVYSELDLSFLMDNNCSNCRVRELISKQLRRGIEDSKSSPFSSFEIVFK